MVRKIIRGVAGVALWLGLAAFAVVIATMAAQHYDWFKLVSVQTDSMRPLMNPGDLLVDAPVDSYTLREGDIVTIPNDITHMLVTHRITDAHEVGPDQYALTLKGDANTAADGNSYVAGKQVLRPILTVPGIGTVLDVMAAHRLGLGAAWLALIAVALTIRLAVKPSGSARPTSRREAPESANAPVGS